MDLDRELSRVLLASAGASVSDDVLRKDVIKEVIYKAADYLSTGELLLPTREFSVLDVAFHFPSTMIGQYPMSPGSRTEYEKLTWTEFDTTMYKAEVKYLITDEARWRELDNYQMTFSARRAAEALAMWKDRNIIDAILAGAYASNNVTVGVGDEWDSGSATADPESDIVDAINLILANSNIQMRQLVNIKVLIPANLWGHLQKLLLIHNVQQRLSEYLRVAFSVEILPTKYTNCITAQSGTFYNPLGTQLVGISDDAYVVIFGEDTGTHNVFNPPIGDPMAETQRINGVGEEWTIRQYFSSKIVPYSSSVTTNPRISKILNVSNAV